MIDLPEATNLAAQIDKHLKGKRVVSVARPTPHKFAFFEPSFDELAKRMPGKTITGASADGKRVFVSLRPGVVFALSDMGGRVLYHGKDAKLPKKQHLCVTFGDGTSLTVSLSLWGFFSLHEAGELGRKPYEVDGVNPIGAEFTARRFSELVAAYEKPHVNSVKAFLVQRPCIKGISNGYAQDIMLRAGLTPRRRMADVSKPDLKKLYNAIKKTMKDATKKRGAEDECDLFGEPGAYVRLLCAKVKKCPQCGASVQKDAFLGGATYSCGTCQT